MPLRPWPEQWLCLIRKPEAGAGPGWWGRFRQVKPEVPDSQVEGLAFKGEVWAGGRHHKQMEAAETSGSEWRQRPKCATALRGQGDKGSQQR